MPFGEFFIELDPLSAWFLIPTLLLSALSAIYGVEYLRSWEGKRSLGPVWFTLLMAGILFVSLVLSLLPVAPLPQVDFPTIQISATLPGGSPETMASSVAQPLERQFAQIPGVAQMTSTSSLGSGSRDHPVRSQSLDRRRRQ